MKNGTAYVHAPKKMIQPNWIQYIKQKHYTSYKTNAHNIQQPSIKAWVQKLQLTYLAKQTRPQWNIHNPENQQIQKTQQLWETTWDATKNIIKKINNKTENNKETNTHVSTRKNKKKQQEQILKLLKTRKTTRH